MGYAAARGGRNAIEAAERLIADQRRRSVVPAVTDAQLTERMSLLVDRVMGEGGLWEPELAAAALRQADGDPIEAAHLLRAHRSTMPRFAHTEAVDTDELEILRRIVPAYRQPPGPQLLGRTTDYTGRMLDLGPVDPFDDAEELERIGADAPPVGESARPADERRPLRLLEVLRDLDLLVERRDDDADPDPVDITRDAVRPGAPRSARLAVMARAETGALVNLWYRNILGPDGYLHEITLGEVRHGRLPVVVTHPVTGETVSVGRVRVTEVEAIEDLDGVGEDRGRFDVGYGLCFGHNEKKAIAMANLDIACERDAGQTPLEQSVLMTTDGLDATGFLEHLKLPHYVTFRSMVERKLAVRAARLDDAPIAEPRLVDAAAGADCA
ncbi:carbon-phosphorus lyase complex subunit PhnI [Ilumatobacter sp.]|uniref:carbon-phosphorus lyase complex subunit PhnI n=1 Tax=Ilumatobacter sp. TaxID=1967498 RepID=UPI003C37DA6D